MKKFLDEVARHLYAAYGTAVSELRIVFPGKRARLFFNEALLALSDGRPMWQPRYLSMDDLIHNLSPLAAGERLRLVAELYRIYAEYHDETFDRFFRWGEMLLADFDTIDKYGIDAAALYANVSDLRDIEARFGGLFAGNDEAMTLVRNFWSTLDRKGVQSDEQRQFLKIWRSLADIYARYKARLRELGIGYSGMIYRDVAESLDPSTPDSRFDGQTFCFVGFNALNDCEKRLFDYLRETGVGQFYWDYDNYFYKSDAQEAGRFIRRDIARFGDDAPKLEHDNFERPKQIEVISTPSDILQCKALYGELKRIYDKQGYIDKETAIVLTDESLLLSVLHSIPPEVDRLNVTMGYPLTGTVPYLLLERLLSLQRHVRDGLFSHTDVSGILNHPYVIERCGYAARQALKRMREEQAIWVGPDFFAGERLLERIFRPVAGVEETQAYLEEILSGFGAVDSDTEEARERKEFIFTILDHVARLRATIRDCGIELTPGIYNSLLRQTLAQSRVPYEGEPLSGLQIMGILETRNLDFDNVILLSLTDDTFPGNREGSSYIPFNLRQAFGLPTPQDHEAMYAYYFYRLIARCRRLTMMYSSAADERCTGEQSRYIYQLEYESRHRVERSNVNLQIDYRPVEPIQIEKSPELLQRLGEMEFYPSNLNRYIDCPLKFYFADIEHLKTPEELEEETTHLDVGNTLHKALERLYAPFLKRPDTARAIAAIDREEVLRATEEAMVEVMGARGKEVALSGRMQLHRDTVARYAENILRYDAGTDTGKESFAVVGIEKLMKQPFRFGDREIILAGKADRIDRFASGGLRIVDYKSGGDIPEFPNAEALFTNEVVNTHTGELRYEAHNGAVLQVLLYGLILGVKAGEGRVRPELYVARRMGSDGFSPIPSYKEESGGVVEVDPMNDEVRAALLRGLEELFASMFDAATPFVQTEHRQKCAVCDFRNICRR